MDYELIDISDWCNAGVECLSGESLMLGEQTMRGLPFTVGALNGQTADDCYVSLADGDASVTLPFGKTAHNVVSLHIARWRPSNPPTVRSVFMSPTM